MTNREPHTASTLIDRMDKAGLVKKVKDLKKKNLVRITITAKGRRAYNHSTKRESIHRMMACLSKEEHQKMNSGLETLHDCALEEIGK